uniref:CS domain-containing protein n=1 Tax=Compsopogon caeruleus TaxID=31354 RepID=A0A6T6C5W4_9RHOD|mmetsp:Transcript_17415/g.36153  ORF Transcript_17415/g.36153 Transcript_17415/m.36153 type:complete len:425 (+) Transcript_17415:1589-2863(+)
MITPLFRCDQTAEAVEISVKLPYIRAKDVEFQIDDGCEVMIYVKPYFLRLRLPGEIDPDEADGPTDASYDLESGWLRLKLRKARVGQEFPGLELLSRLLVSSSQKDKRLGQSRRIQVLGSTSEGTEAEEEEEVHTGDNENDVINGLARLGLQDSHKRYGFAERYSRVFEGRQEDLSEILENPDPDEIPRGERSAMRELRELARFSEDHYCADFAETEEVVKPLLEFQDEVSSGSFDDDELRMLVTLPGYSFFPDVDNVALNDLANILFAYCYDRRTTLGESTVESSWTITMISPTLAWLESFSRLETSLVAAFRRSLVYPLYRHFSLSQKVLEDCRQLFRAGPGTVLRALLHMKSMFESSESRFVLSTIFLIDYCIWIQGLSDSLFKSFTNEMEEFKIEKSEMPWDLVELERQVLEAGGRSPAH